ncbi:MAG: helix-turn-helix domain-containing protein [Bacteroidota bacterium]
MGSFSLPKRPPPTWRFPCEFYRIKARFVADGDAGLLHLARGRPSNFGFSPRVKQEVLDLYRRKYADYGPTLFAERMERNEGYCIEHETLRRWLQRAALLP